jgi:hypothetical protein
MDDFNLMVVGFGMACLLPGRGACPLIAGFEVEDMEGILGAYPGKIVEYRRKLRVETHVTSSGPIVPLTEMNESGMGEVSLM